jgi:predicted enzyme related to lactoylglutathione lyase
VLGLKYLLDVTDMDRSVAFYTGAFGLEVAVQSPDWSELRFGDAVVALHGGGGGGAGAGGPVRTGLSFTVADLDAAVAAVESNGGRVVQAPFSPGGEGIRLAELADPDGNVFMASQVV